MNYKMIGRFLAQIIAIESVFMIPALLISLCLGEWASVNGFLLSLAVTILLAGVLYWICHRAGNIFGAREGLVCVGFAWILMSFLGALPFVFSGAIPRYIDAFFETVSGFTTTGASILSDVEALPWGIKYWRKAPVRM